MDEDDVKNRGKPPKGDDASGSPDVGNLLGLFAPPPPSAQAERSETDPLIPSSPAENDASRTIALALDAEDWTPTVRRINHETGEYNSIDRGQTTTHTGIFQNEVKPSENEIEPSTNRSAAVAPSPISVMTTVRSVLAPFLLPSTWIGGILFVLYHVVFCMANGGSIVRPHSSGGASLLGDMTRYAAVGIIASCPYLVYALSDKRGFTGIPALYPSTDIFLAPFLAQAAAVIDEAIVDDWKAGLILFDNNRTYSSGGEGGALDLEDEQLLTELWFGSFALVVSFGMLMTGFLLILASKIKLANLGTYLPYGVLCGFFSAVGILMWKMAISIDTPTSLPTDGGRHHWTVVLLHHLPSLAVGIAMNVLGPKHPFFVTGLILLTIAAFYGVMMVLGISLEDAEANGWFYSEGELASSTASSASFSSGNPWWHEMLPPHPFGTWFAVFGRRVHWRAVVVGAEHMVALAILYLLRASIHATALKKNIHNLLRRVPIQQTTATEAAGEPKVTIPSGDTKNEGGHRRSASTDSVFSTLHMASHVAQYVRDEVRIVNMSCADGRSLRGKCYSQSPPPRNPFNRKTSSASNATSVFRNTTNKVSGRNVHRKHSVGLTNLVVPIPVSNVPNPLRNQSTTSNDHDNDALLLPTLPREVSGLTHRSSPHSSRYVDGAAAQKNLLLEQDPIGNGTNSPSTMDYMEIHPPATDLTLEDIFAEYGYGYFVTGLCGGFGCCPQIATSKTMYVIGADKPVPQYFSAILLLVAFYSSGFELVRFIPKAAFSSLLVLGAIDNIITWFLKPISKMDNLMKWSVVPFITGFSLLVGMLNAIVLGIGMSTFLFVADFFRVGVVKYEATGLEIRSRIERSLVESVWLDTHGDTLRVLVLQNYIFFGNASSLLWYIETMFEEISVEEPVDLAYLIPPVPIVLVLDLSLITGMDTSAVDAFMDIWRSCKTNNCKLYLCGLSPRLKKTFAKGGMRPDTKGARKSRTLLYFSDLDHGLGRAEDVLIEKDMGDFANESLFQLKRGTSGFHVALQHIDQLHVTNMAEGLLALEPYIRTVILEPGETLYEEDGGLIKEEDRGLFFIESGMIREEDSRSNRTNTRTGGSLRLDSLLVRSNDSTLRGKHARLNAAAQRAGINRRLGGEASNQSNNLRIATAGPGWVVGANEFATGRHSLKKLKSITKVKMHHLCFFDLKKIEEENPALVLRLYKMLTHVMARKEEDTVAHLSTLHDILSSNVHSLLVQKSSRGSFLMQK